LCVLIAFLGVYGSFIVWEDEGELHEAHQKVDEAAAKVACCIRTIDDPNVYQLEEASEGTENKEAAETYEDLTII
jgi:hypothetical protein